MELSYTFSQICVIIAYLLCGIGFLHKSRIKILYFSSYFNAFMLLQYVLLGGTMGIVASIVNLIRNILFIYNQKKNKPNSLISLFVLFCITIILTFCFYTSLIDLIPCCLALLGTFTYWNSNTKVIRLCNLLCSVCYIVYAIPLKSFMIIVCEMYLIGTTIVGFIRNENIGDKSVRLLESKTSFQGNMC